MKMKRQKVIFKGKESIPDLTKETDGQAWKYYVALGFILILTVAVYYPSLLNGFVYWDDYNYIENNQLVHTIDLRNIFSTYVKGNYHPLTILAYAIQYHYFGLEASEYHVVNLLIHILNTVLVARVILSLTKSHLISLVTSLLFGIHPLHVESVAWAAELKDLLYTFFFLLSFICYLNYTDKKATKYYIFALLLFIASLLSKAMAVSLPVLFIMTDYFKGRTINVRGMIEKIPFFGFSILFGIIGILAQKTSGATDIVNYTFPQRIVFACYGYMSYIFKLIIPLKQSAFYPYPLNTGSAVPDTYYFYVILLLGILFLIYYSLRFSRKVLFGMGFFSISVFLVLQLLPVGGAIMADRYSYIPSIGLFYLIGEGLNLLWHSKFKSISIIILGGFTVFFSVKTFARCGIWKDQMTLWNDMIDNYQTIPFAYNNRANVLINQGKYRDALSDYTKAIELNRNFGEAYNNRGSVFVNLKKYDSAVADYTKAIEINANYGDAYANRANMFMTMKKYDLAYKDYSKVIELTPHNIEPYINRANLLRAENKTEEALNDYNKALDLKPNFPNVYLERGILFSNIGQKDKAIFNFTKAIEFNNRYVEAYVNRGNVLLDEGKFNEALSDYNKVIDLNPRFSIAYLNCGSVYMQKKMYDEAIRNYSKAISLDVNYAKAYFLRGVAENFSGNKNAACLDIRDAARLGYPVPEDALKQICY